MTAQSASKEASILRRLNKSAVFEAIRAGTNGISRAEISRRAGLSRATVSAIVDELIREGIVVETGVGASPVGRRPTLLELSGRAGRVVGVDIGATHLIAALADLRGQVLAEAEVPFAIGIGPEKSLARVFELVEGLLAQAECGLEEVQAAAVGVPGPVILAEGLVSAPPIMPGWDGFPIRQRIEAHWGKPTTLDNDADLGAAGEWTFGAGQGESNLAYIKIGTGIGCGLLHDGQIYHGVLGTAGEIGHVTISLDGPPCTCGNYGCLEAMAGGRAIAQRALLAVQAGQRTSLAELPNPQEITARDVALAAQAGDVVSQQLLNDAGRHIGSAVASLINLLNPGLVLIGGGVGQAGDYLLEPLRQAVNERSMRASLRSTRIEMAALGRRSTAMGAVSVALAKAFEHITSAAERGNALATARA